MESTHVATFELFCERRYIEIDAFALIDVALTIERQVQAVLGEQDMGQQLGPCAPARDRVRGGQPSELKQAAYCSPYDAVCTNLVSRGRPNFLHSRHVFQHAPGFDVPVWVAWSLARRRN